MPEPLFSYAYGQRAIPKLAELLCDKSRTEEERIHTLYSLKSALASQEEKCSAVSATPSIPERLAQLIQSETEPVRRLSADCLASLAMVIQGRIAIASHGLVPSITAALKDASPGVRTSAAAALHSISNSRDGCSLLAADAIVQALVMALDEGEQVTTVAALSALANLTRLDIGVLVALEAGAVAKLQRCMEQGHSRGNQKLLLSALQCTFNISNTPDGKAQAINADLLKTLAFLCTPYKGEPLEPEVTRLAVGCMMAITVAKAGKFKAAESCVEPLCDILIDVDTDAFTLRSVIAAIKNISEFPKAREEFSKRLAPHGIDMLVIADNAVWPDSNRYVHQNIAPGGIAFEADKALRTQWGYPEPHPGDI
mmetsp:Transcript_35444/g.82111  ORF Transcript_35444/g.82111 Transcript_35444/m.82111 type:complete len:369 (-) Transcript_35444:259-1365(-)